MTVRPLSLECEHGTEMLLILIKTIFDLKIDMTIQRNVRDGFVDQPSIKDIKSNLAPNSSLTFRHTTEEIVKVLKSLNPKKAIGPDQIPPELIKISNQMI